MCKEFSDPAASGKEMPRVWTALLAQHYGVHSSWGPWFQAAWLSTSTDISLWTRTFCSPYLMCSPQLWSPGSHVCLIPLFPTVLDSAPFFILPQTPRVQTAGSLEEEYFHCLQMVGGTTVEKIAVNPAQSRNRAYLMQRNPWRVQLPSSRNFSQSVCKLRFFFFFFIFFFPPLRTCLQKWLQTDLGAELFTLNTLYGDTALDQIWHVPSQLRAQAEQGCGCLHISMQPYSYFLN